MIRLPTPAALDLACDLLGRGEVLGMPTETVYGLAADAFQDEAVARIFEVKGRPTFNPLIIHIAEPEEAEQYAYVPLIAQAIMLQLWPGPLTLVLSRKENCPISLLASAGLETIALRCPAHPVASRLLHAYGRPLAAPSANRSLYLSPTSAQDVLDSLGDAVPLILDGGPCEHGLESTIIDVTDPHKIALLRPGSIPLETLQFYFEDIEVVAETPLIKSPGMMKRHYAPHHPLRLNAINWAEGEAYLGFGPLLSFKPTLNLSENGNLREAAANLFRMLRLLDRETYRGIAVSPIPTEGLGMAINDRLRRAATPLEE